MQHIILNHISNECLRALFFIFSKRRVYSLSEDFKQLHTLTGKILKEAPNEENCSKEQNEFYAELQNIFEYLNKLEH